MQHLFKDWNQDGPVLDTEQVLRELLELDQDSVEQLKRQKVI